MSVESSSSHQSSNITFQPHTLNYLLQGINFITRAINPTLGPVSRTVVSQHNDRDNPYKFLDDGVSIAENLNPPNDPNLKAGASLVLSALQKQREQAGEASATTAVMLQTMVNNGAKVISSGGNAMLLQRHLRQGLSLILTRLDEMTIQVEGKEQLSKIAFSFCHDEELSKMLGEIFEIIGEYGYLEIFPGQTNTLERIYEEGLSWKRGVDSREMLFDKVNLRSELQDAAILISDLDINQPNELIPVYQTAISANIKSLLLIARNFSNAARAFIIGNNKQGKLKAIAVRTPGFTDEERAAALEDIEALTGGKRFLKITGAQIQHISKDDFGYARHIWADEKYFGISGGKGNPRVLREHIKSLKLSAEKEKDPDKRDKILERVSKLMGGSASLWIGGETEIQINHRVELAKKTASALRSVLKSGVVAGGGIALFRCCQPLLLRRNQANNPEEKAAYTILAQALEAPLLTILANSGLNPQKILAVLENEPPNIGYDVYKKQIVNMKEAGILDPASAIKSAVQIAVSTASTALTVDVLIKRPQKNP